MTVRICVLSTTTSAAEFFFETSCCVSIHITDLGERQDQEGPASAGFHDDRQELRVDSAEGAVPRHLGHPDVIVGLLGLHRLAEDVAELALPHDAATHG